MGLQATNAVFTAMLEIHWPFRLRDGAVTPPMAGDILDIDMEGVWREIEKPVTSKLVRDIGVCNFTTKKLEKLVKFAQIMPSICQMEMHPGWRNDKMLDACKRSGIHGTAYSPLGSGERDLINNPVIGSILVEWALQKGASVIPKSTNPDRIKENIMVAGCEIPPENFQELSSIPDQRKVLDGADMFVNPKEGL